MHSFTAAQQRPTQLIVEGRCGGLFHFAGHGAGDAALAAPLAVGCASTLESHSGFFVLCILPRGVIPVFYKCQQSQQVMHMVFESVCT